MQAAIEFAGYVLLATALFGAVIGFFLIRSYWYQPSPVAPHPGKRQLPNEAVGAIRGALGDVRRRLGQSSGEARERLEAEVLRLERRVALLEQKTLEEQWDYRKAVKRRLIGGVLPETTCTRAATTSEWVSTSTTGHTNTNRTFGITMCPA